MMKEDQFPGFLNIYRQLRKEGVNFPPRDSNMRMLMENVCSDSPMFDFVEQAAGKEVRSSLASVSANPAAAGLAASENPFGRQSTIPTEADKLATFVSQFEGDFGEVEFDE